MNDEVIEVKVHQVVPVNHGAAIFVGNQAKIFPIFVSAELGETIHLFIKGIKRPRPLTHDLIGSIFAGLGVKVERIVINDLKKEEHGGTYYARLILSAENELGKKLIEIDARPSDSIALALQQKCSIYVARHVFDAVQDATYDLKKINEKLRQGGDPSEPTGAEEDEDEEI